MNRLLSFLPIFLLFQTNTQVDYRTQIKNKPIVTGSALPVTCAVVGDQFFLTSSTSNVGTWYSCAPNLTYVLSAPTVGNVFVTPQQFATPTSTCAGTGGDDTGCLMNMQATLQQMQNTAIAANNTIFFNIQSPPGLTYHFWNNRWLWGLQYYRFDFNGSSIQNTCTNPNGSTGGSAPWCGTLDGTWASNGWYGNNRGIFSNLSITAPNGFGYQYGYLINTMNPGDTTGSTVTSTDMNNFRVGQWVMIASYDQQFGGFPPNYRYFNFAKLTAISGGNFTLDRNVTYLHSSNYPEASDNTNYCGRARIINIDRTDIPFSIYGEIDNMTVLQPVRTDLPYDQAYYYTNGTYKTIFRNCKFISLGVSAGTKDFEVYDSDIYYLEVDKDIDHVLFQNTRITYPTGGSGANTVEMRGGEATGAATFNGKQVIYDGVTFKGATSFVHGSTTNLQPNALALGGLYNSVRNSIFLGKNNSNDNPTAFYIPTLGPTYNYWYVTVDGTINTLVNNYTLTMPPMSTSGSGSSTQAQQRTFIGCAEVGSIIFATPPTLDGAPRWGTVRKIYGGLGNTQVDISFNTTIPNGYALSCSPLQSIDMTNNVYKNWLLDQANNGPNAAIWPWAPRTNIENQVTNGGRIHNYTISNAVSAGHTRSIVGFLKSITVTVDQAYTGVTTPKTLQIKAYNYPGSPNWTQNEIINIATPGTRIITANAAPIGTQTGDTLAQLPFPYAWTNQIIFVWCNSGCAPVSYDPTNALVHITIEMDIPFNAPAQTN